MRLPRMSRVALVALGAVLAMQCVLAQRRPGATNQAVEQSSMVITFYNSEYQPMYSQNSQCELLVRRAAKHGGRRIQFVPTHYWYEKVNEQYPANTCLPDNWSIQNKVDWYCTKFEWNSDCRPFDQGAIDAFKTGFTKCLKVAAELFDEIMVAPHLDEGLKRGKWRNMLHNDPFWKDPNGYSFWDIMQKPILDAANEAIPAGKKFWFGVEGEMGGTVLSWPAQYLKMYQMIKTGWKSPAQLYVGATFNHAYIMGYITRGPGTPPVLPPSPMAAYDGGWGPVLPFEQWPNYAEAKKNLPAIRKLLEASDFLGVSNYARAGDGMNVQPHHIESGVAKLHDEFAAMGINLKRIIKDGNKVFMYNEFGMGGGISECGDTPGQNTDIGFFPWLGITVPYTPEADPFKKFPATKDFLIKYYDTALDVLARGGDEFPVHHSYIWNCVSWDVQGIHTASALWNTDVDQGDWPVKNGFAVQEVIDMIKVHNRKFSRAERSPRRPAAQQPSRRSASRTQQPRHP